MKKIVLSLFVILTFGFYLYYKSNNSTEVMSALWTQSKSSNSQTASTNIAYKDGDYTGDVTDAFYGNIQVKVTVASGKISDVEFLQYPNDRQTSEQINSQAMPILTKEAITAQNSKVDIVTGATQSSEAFQKSLQSALDQAKS